MQNLNLTEPSVPAIAKLATHDAASFRLICAVLGLTCLFLVSSNTLAQDSIDLRFLIFDAVPIVTVDPGSTEEQGYLAVEPAEPGTGSPINLRNWLASQDLPAFDLEQESAENLLAATEILLRELELSGGPFSPLLRQELQAKGNLLFRSGDIDTALETYDRAAHIIRVNEGLFSLNQIPLVEEIIEAHLARGDLLAANEQQEYLFYLQQKAYNDSSPEQLLEALNNFAEWNLFAFNANYLDLASNADEDNNLLDSFSFQTFRAESLLKAQMLYMQIIDILSNRAQQDDQRLADAERALAITNYLYLTNFDFSSEYGSLPEQRPYDFSAMPKNSLSSRMGMDALERRIDYLASLENMDPLAVLKARLDLTDWLLFSKKRMNALESLQLAWEEASSNGVSSNELNALLYPAYPQAVPAFAHPRYSRESLKVPQDLKLHYKGYIDLEFTLSQFGLVRSIEILGTSPETVEDINERLLRSLRRSQFRPRFRDGEFVKNDQISARFYYTY